MSDSDPASAKKIICSLFCFCVWADCRFNASTQIRRIDRAILQSVCDRQMAFRSTFTALCPSKLVEGKTVHRRPCLGERVSSVRALGGFACAWCCSVRLLLLRPVASSFGFSVISFRHGFAIFLAHLSRGAWGVAQTFRACP